MLEGTFKTNLIHPLGRCGETWGDQGYFEADFISI